MLGYSGVVLVSLNLIMYGDDQAESVATIFESLFSSWALTIERLQLWPCLRLGFHYSRMILTTKEVWVGPYLHFSALHALKEYCQQCFCFILWA